MANSNPVAYDSQSFILNNERVFLTSGALHYFRIPRACGVTASKRRA
jgi:beta-galactosidase GanA